MARRFKVNVSDIRFYQLTWPAKLTLMGLFEWETVEEAADTFNNNPIRFLLECWPDIEYITMNVGGYVVWTAYDNIFLSRYQGKRNGYY